MMDRRDFIHKATIGTLSLASIASGFMIGGCNAVTDLENWIPVALTAVSQIVKLLGPLVPAPVSAAIVIIQAAFSALLTAIQNYKKGSGVLADISSAIAAAEAAFQSFFATLSVPSGLLATIEGLAAIILSTIQAFANEINPTPAPTLAVNGKAVPFSSKKRSLRQFKADWNTECVSTGHPEAEL